MVWWLSPRAYKTVLYRIILQKRSIFTQFLAKFLSKFFQIIISLYFFIFCNLKKTKSNSLVTVWNALGLSHQTTLSLNYSQSIKINIGPSEGGTIILSSRRPTVLNQRLTEFMSERLVKSHTSLWQNYGILCLVKWKLMYLQNYKNLMKNYFSKLHCIVDR